MLPRNRTKKQAIISTVSLAVVARNLVLNFGSQSYSLWTRATIQVVLLSQTQAWLFPMWKLVNCVTHTKQETMTPSSVCYQAQQRDMHRHFYSLQRRKNNQCSDGSHNFPNSYTAQLVGVQDAARTLSWQPAGLSPPTGCIHQREPQ